MNVRKIEKKRHYKGKQRKKETNKGAVLRVVLFMMSINGTCYVWRGWAG